ncbi:hypothetical protein SFRURICE_015181 [Spodoptera frugiperda]|nr:hypothetical protein SFRURICE_015181 [Spodoptera frugiperda]
MDDFGDNFVQPEVDPAAEFLAREQNQLAGLEDELETSAPPPIVSSSNGLDDFVDAEEEKKKEEMLKIAKKELEDWYKTHEETIAKTKAANRNAEKALARGSEGTVEDGNEWERVAELCDFGPRRGRDVARLRSIVLQLKQSGVRPKHPPRTTKVA